MKKQMFFAALAGIAAGIINGLFGAGGGLVLIPFLRHGPFLQEDLFRVSLLIILPMSMVSLILGANQNLPWQVALPYLLGGIPGGIAAARLGRQIPTHWLHRILGCFILYGGIRYLW